MKCDQIRKFLWIWSRLLKKSLMVIFLFCVQFSSSEDGVQVIIVHSLMLRQIIGVIGLICFVACPVPFYPQVNFFINVSYSFTPGILRA